MDMQNFASESYPLRCSALPLLVTCPLRASLMFSRMLTDESGKAADTGSAVHKAIEVWHTNGQDARDALKSMEAAIADYPLADLHDAALHFRPYIADPRNIEAEIVVVEKKITFALSPAETDETGKMIYVTGTLDQIRREHGRCYLYDVKTGQKYDGWTMMHTHALQIAAYCVGATQCLGYDVLPGAIIATRGYRKRGVQEVDPPGVFYQFAWGLPECHRLLDSVRHTVADIRSGRISIGPGEHCSFCPARGLDTCLPLARSL